MMLKQLVICATLLLQHSIVWAQSIDDTVAGLNNLAQDSNQADENAINAANGLIGASRIPRDILLLTNDALNLISGNEGVPATTEPAVETQVTDGFKNATEAMDQFLVDLGANASVIIELRQGSHIYAALSDLERTYLSLSYSIKDLLTSEAAKNTTIETWSNAYATFSYALYMYSPVSELR